MRRSQSRFATLSWRTSVPRSSSTPKNNSAQQNRSNSVSRNTERYTKLKSSEEVVTKIRLEQIFGVSLLSEFYLRPSAMHPPSFNPPTSLRNAKSTTKTDAGRRSASNLNKSVTQSTVRSVTLLTSPFARLSTGGSAPRSSTPSSSRIALR